MNKHQKQPYCTVHRISHDSVYPVLSYGKY